MTLNLPPARITRAVCALLAIVFALTTCWLTPAGTVMAPSASADDATATDTTGTTNTDDKQRVTITIDAATPVVTASSGYQLRATVTNPTGGRLPAGKLNLATNVQHSFYSRTDIQDWSDGAENIPMLDGLAEADVPALDAGASASVTLTADKDTLARIITWGPKPVAVTYVVDGVSRARSHTFLTRSTDGLNLVETPALNLTVALPLTSSAWSIDENAMHDLLTNSSDDDQVVTAGDASVLDDARREAIAKHPKLQVVADPTLLTSEAKQASQSHSQSQQDDTAKDQAKDQQETARNLSSIALSGVMQPAGFDISAYNAHDNDGAYVAAGVERDDWNAETALGEYRTAKGDQSLSTGVYAWQGKANWSLASLTEAKKQGYSVVIANHEFDTGDDSTVHTGNMSVTTDEGDVTVLTQQRELSRLAQGKATSDDADAETSAAGRLARFVAQSAFYQMEQPYTSRNLLVCLSATADAATIDALMRAVEQSPWLNLTDLSTLAATDPYVSGDDALQLVQDDASLTAAQSSFQQQTLSTLANGRNGITRFASSVLLNGDGRADPWIKELLDTQSTIALHALGGDMKVAERMNVGATSMVDELMGGVVITPSESVTVVSETAKMPVTISNSYPYPVHVKVQSVTDSMEIVTSRQVETEVPAHGEAQVTFTIRVSTSGSTNARITLLDRNGTQFGDTQTTAITSVLRISDMSGFVIIGFAFLLGILGLWRQFNRKKDPDE
ncbi:hypothetical protein DSM100688_1665 [Bifidobacterium ramosum]|nr:hypothetical protein DSM100688_1665 [Bifidobacterium ramosum]